jgi:sugar/nucleoside kinase (ribokinase family)
MTPMSGVLDWLLVGDAALEESDGAPGTILAGGAARLALHAAALGAHAALVAKVGDDEAGRRVREILARHKLDLRWLKIAPGLGTTVWHEPAGHPERRSVTRGADLALRLDEIPSALAAPAPLTVVSGYSLCVEPARSAAMGALAAARRRHSRSALLLEADRLFGTNAHMTRRVLEPALALADSVALSSADVAALFGARVPGRDALRQLLRFGPKTIYLTESDGGVLLQEGGRLHRCPADDPHPPRDLYAGPAAFWVGLARAVPARKAAVAAVHYAQSVRRAGTPNRAAHL